MGTFFSHQNFMFPPRIIALRSFYGLLIYDLLPFPLTSRHDEGVKRETSKLASSSRLRRHVKDSFPFASSASDVSLPKLREQIFMLLRMAIASTERCLIKALLEFN
jgi:hypothetical protein